LLDSGSREGFLPYRIGIDAMAWLESRCLTQGSLAARLRNAIDPERILAPGRYG